MPASGKYYSRPRRRQLLQNGGLGGTMASRPGLRPAACKVSMVYDLFMLGMSMGRSMDNIYIYIHKFLHTYKYIYIFYILCLCIILFISFIRIILIQGLDTTSTARTIYY